MSKRKHEQVTALSSNNNYDAILLNNKKIIILIGQNKDSEAIWVTSVYNELKTLLLTDPSTKKAKLESIKLLANAKKLRNIYMLDDLESESSDNEDFDNISNSGSEISEY